MTDLILKQLSIIENELINIKASIYAMQQRDMALSNKHLALKELLEIAQNETVTPIKSEEESEK